MNDLNGTALAALAAALAPYLVTELAKVSSGMGGNPAAQQGGGAGAQQNSGAAFGGQQPQQFAGAPAATPQPQPANPFGQTASPVNQSAPSVTPDMIQQLIIPLVQNEQVKAALTAQMQQMGITNLPDARPDQLPELYQRFQTIDQQARAAGLIGSAGAAAPGII